MLEDVLVACMCVYTLQNKNLCRDFFYVCDVIVLDIDGCSHANILHANVTCTIARDCEPCVRLAQVVT